MKEWIPEEIKAFRKKRGLYQKELASLLRVSTNYIYLLEKGVRSPSDTMRALLDCLQEKENEKGKESAKHGKRNL